MHWEEPEESGGEGGGRGGSGWGIHVNPWLINVNVWQKPLQYCKVISLQIIKINGKKNKVLHTICQQIWKTSRDHRTEKGQSSSQFPRRAILKNVQTSRQLHSSPMLVRLCSKFSKLGFSITWIENFQMFKLALERAEEPEIKLPAFPGSWRKQGNSRKKKKDLPLFRWLC